MPTLTIEYRNDAERLAYEQAIAFVTQLHQVAATAPDGNVLAVCEKVALEGGRELLRNTLAAAVQQRVASAQQKGGPPASAPARTPDATRGNMSEPFSRQSVPSRPGKSTPRRAGGMSKWASSPGGSGGAPASAAEWDQRGLPAPSVRSVVAAIEEASAFGDRCRAEAERLRWTDPTTVSVLGDGAEWIWNLAGRQFPGASAVLDIFHGAEHIAQAAQCCFGEGTAAARVQGERGRQRLLEDGYWGVTEWVGEVSGVMPAGGEGASLGGMLNYFADHQERLGYALRLRRGQSIQLVEHRLAAADRLHG